MNVRRNFLRPIATSFGVAMLISVAALLPESFGQPVTCDLTLKWFWDDPTVYRVWSTLVVVNLTDDNGDGVVDGCDNPEVAFIASDVSGQVGRLIVVNGTTGDVLPGFPVGETLTWGSLAAADIVGDQVAELIALRKVGWTCTVQVVAFSPRGVEVVTGEPTGALECGLAYAYINHARISVADLNRDGTPEILVGEAVFDGTTGDLLWDGTGTGEEGGRGILSMGSRTSTGVNLDSDEDLEVLAGNRAYEWGGDILWQFGTTDGASAVGNYDDDNYPEVVFVYKDTIQLLDHEGNAVGLPFEFGHGGPSYYHPGVFPALGQFDDDLEPEVAETDGDSLWGLDFSSGSWAKMWAVDINDLSTRAGISLADLDGDGIDEVLYRDEDTLWIVDGYTGTVEWQTPIIHGTGIDYPVAADIDGDDRMEVVVAGRDLGDHLYFHGVSAFDCSTWVDGRRVWNDYTYHVTNINEDGTVPVNQDPSWLNNNSFLAQENECVACSVQVSGDWTIEIVKDETSGPYNAIALRDNSFPHIGFHDESEGGLWYAFKDTILPPRCPRYPQWKIVQVDAAQAGHWTSIDILSGLTRAEFSHVDSSNWNIQWAADVGVDSVGCGITLDRYELDTAGDLGTYGTDLAIDTSDDQTSTGIVYYDGTRENLKYAERTEAGWNLVTLDSDGDVGRYPAIAIDASGKRHVSYYDATNGDLKYMYCPGNCTTAGNWSRPDTVDTSGVVGLFTEIAVDGLGKPHISYIDSTHKSLKYAYLGLTWVATTIEDSPNDLIAATAIGVGVGDTVHISYSDRTNKTLKYASCSSFCINPNNWDTVTVPDPWSDVGLWNSIAVGVGDTIHISYSASDSLCDFKALKYAKGKP